MFHYGNKIIQENKALLEEERQFIEEEAQFYNSLAQNILEEFVGIDNLELIEEEGVNPFDWHQVGKLGVGLAGAAAGAGLVKGFQAWQKAGLGGITNIVKNFTSRGGIFEKALTDTKVQEQILNDIEKNPKVAKLMQAVHGDSRLKEGITIQDILSNALMAQLSNPSAKQLKMIKKEMDQYSGIEKDSQNDDNSQDELETIKQKAKRLGDHIETQLSEKGADLADEDKSAIINALKPLSEAINEPDPEDPAELTAADKKLDQLMRSAKEVAKKIPEYEELEGVL